MATKTGFIVFRTKQDLNEIFALRTSAAGPNTGYIKFSTGQDLSQIFEPYASGIKALTTGFKLADKVTDLRDVFKPIAYSFTGATQTGTASAVVLTYKTDAAANSVAQLVGTFSIPNSNKITNLKILMVSGGGGGGWANGANSGGGGGGGNVVLNTVATASNFVANVFVGCGGAGTTSTTFAQTSSDSSLTIVSGTLSGNLSAPNNGLSGSRTTTASTTQVSPDDTRVGAGAGGGGGASTGFAANLTICKGGTSTTGGRGGNATSYNDTNFYGQFAGGGGGGGTGGQQGTDVSNAARIGNGGNGTTHAGFSTYGGGGGAGGPASTFPAINAPGGTGGGGAGNSAGVGTNGTPYTGGGGGGGLSGGGAGANGTVIISFTVS